MKKFWKYVLITLLVLVLGAGGTIYYFLNVKTYETADEEIAQLTDSEYEIELPEIDEPTDSTDDPSNTDTTEGSSNNDSSNSGDTSSSSAGSNGDTTAVSTNTGKSATTTNEQKTPIKEITVAQIKNTYRPVFESLEAQANAKIDGLVNRAIGEYQQKKNNGESISFAYFYQKYTSAGKDLENKTDNAFTYVYSALEDSLKKHGYSPNHAKEFKEQYENAKSAREAALINKAKEAL